MRRRRDCAAPRPAAVQGRVGAARTIWPEGAELPTADAPALAVVMVPREATSSVSTAPSSSEGTLAPSQPHRPGCSCSTARCPGRGRQPGAVNTTDGGTLYDVAFALVYADEDTVLNTNEAYALASCTGCQTVAVAFQVVLVLGEANVVVPEPPAAVNYARVQCVTYALATQLLLTVSGPWVPTRRAGSAVEGARGVRPVDQGPAPLGACRHGSPSSRRRSRDRPLRPGAVPAASADLHGHDNGAGVGIRCHRVAHQHRHAGRPWAPAVGLRDVDCLGPASATQEPPPATTPAPEATTLSAPATTEPTETAEPAVTSTTPPATAAP